MEIGLIWLSTYLPSVDAIEPELAILHPSQHAVRAAEAGVAAIAALLLPLPEANSAAATDWAITDWDQEKTQRIPNIGAWFMREDY